jgi:hypothetical protein
VSGTESFNCAFYLHDDGWLLAQQRQRPFLRYSLEYLKLVAGELLTFPECNTQIEADLLQAMSSTENKSFSFLSHGCVRLTCNHPGYAPLWIEQLGESWLEPGKPSFTWPALATDDERWSVRAAIDTVVADAYGLTRDQYAHVLATFKHTNYPKAPELCLGMFDELKSIGIGAFTKKHDPYWDIPLNENLPQPVIDLPGFGSAKDEGFALEAAPRPRRKRGRQKS